MGFDDALNKAKEFAGDNPEKVDQLVEQGTEKVKDVTPDQHDDKVDQAVDAARDKLGF